MYLALLAILFAVFAIITWRNLKLGLFLLAAILPVYLLRFSVGPLPTTALEVLIVILILIWLIRYQGWKKISLNELRPWTQPILLLLAAACFSVVVAIDTLSAFGIWKAYFVEPILIFLIARTELRTKTDQVNLLKALAMSALIVSAVAFGQYLTGLGLPAPWDLEKRVTGVFEYPNALGLFLAPIVTLSVVMLLKQKKSRLLWLMTSIIGLSAIVLAKTEAAFVAIPLAVIIALLFSNIKKKVKYHLAAETIIVALILILTSTTIQQKLFLQDYSGQARVALWQESIQMLTDQPIFGAGLNAFPSALEPYHDPTFYEIFQYPHNIFLNIWSELGLLGLVAFFWLAWVALQSQRKQPSSAIHLAIFAALIAMVIHGLVDAPYFKNDLAVMTWLLLALMSQTSTKALQK